MSAAAPSAFSSSLDLSIQAYAQIFVWPRSAVPKHFTWYFFQHSIRAQNELLLCVYSPMIRSHERRALDALLSLFSTR